MIVKARYTSTGMRNIARLISWPGILRILLFRTKRYNATELKNINRLATIQFIALSYQRKDLGRKMDSFENRKIEIDITLLELQSLYAGFGLVADFEVAL